MTSPFLSAALRRAAACSAGLPRTTVPTRRIISGITTTTPAAPTNSIISSSSSSSISSRRFKSSSSSSPWEPQDYPRPQRLPEAEQREWDDLMRKSGTDSGFSPSAVPEGYVVPEGGRVREVEEQQAREQQMKVQEEGKEGETTADGPLRKGAKPEFEGDTNPKTGEVGGPKNEPLRWGAGGDYSFNGRVTDF